MKTTTIDTDQIKKNTNLIDLASRYTELRRESSKESSGACPKCGGDNRFHVKDDMFFCRQCYDLHNNKPHDAIAFVQWVEGCDFVTACNILGGNVAVSSRPVVQPMCKKAPIKPWDGEKELSWVNAMHRSLMCGQSEHAAVALNYLIERGVRQEAITAYKIGFRFVTLPATWDETQKLLSYPKQLAISLPWFDHEGALVAVKYRFIESHTYTDIDGKKRTVDKTSRGEMAGEMFGWQVLKGSDTCRTLVICEGETNALSIWLASGGTMDVLSAGNESQLKRIPQIAAEKAKKYGRVIIWACLLYTSDAADE